MVRVWRFYSSVSFHLLNLNPTDELHTFVHTSHLSLADTETDRESETERETDRVKENISEKCMMPKCD